MSEALIYVEISRAGSIQSSKETLINSQSSFPLSRTAVRNKLSR